MRSLVRLLETVASVAAFGGAVVAVSHRDCAASWAALGCALILANGVGSREAR